VSQIHRRAPAPENRISESARGAEQLSPLRSDPKGRRYSARANHRARYVEQ
jgi:hypothetical protein